MTIYLLQNDGRLSEHVRAVIGQDGEFTLKMEPRLADIAEVATASDFLIVTIRSLRAALRSEPGELARLSARSWIVVVLSRVSLAPSDKVLRFVHGCILPETLPRLREVMRLAEGGHCIFPHDLVTSSPDASDGQDGFWRLSSIECALLLALDLGNGREPRPAAGILPPDVADYLLQSACRKLGLKTRAEAVTFAARYREELMLWQEPEHRALEPSNGTGPMQRKGRPNA